VPSIYDGQDIDVEENNSLLMSKSEVLSFIRIGFKDLTDVLQQKEPLTNFKIASELSDSRRDNNITLTILGLQGKLATKVFKPSIRFKFHTFAPKGIKNMKKLNNIIQDGSIVSLVRKDGNLPAVFNYQIMTVDDRDLADYFKSFLDEKLIVEIFDNQQKIAEG